MYKARVRPYFGCCEDNLMETTEEIQHQAALAVTGAWNNLNRSKLCEELGWESLSDRRWFRRIL